MVFNAKGANATMDNKNIWDFKWAVLAEYSKKSGGNRWAFSLMKYLLKKIEIGKGNIVDVGCGIGNKTAVLAEIFPSNVVYGIDFSDEAIGNAQKFYKMPNLNFLCGDITSFKSPMEKIEMITTFECLEHIEEWEPVLKTLCNLTDNYIMISVPTGRMRPYEKYMGHYRNFQKGEIEKYMKEQGFEKIDVLYAGFPFFSPIGRNFLNSMGENGDDVIVTFKPIIHEIIYILYRFCSFKRIGDQFMGLFKKVNQ